MPNKTLIEWTDYSSNPFYVTRKSDGKRGWHCVHKSDGCRNCYSETLNTRFGTGLAYKQGHAADLDFHINEDELIKIIRLNGRLAKKGENAKLFVGDMTDIFLDEHTDEMLDKLFAAMALSPNITFQILTKRPERMLKYFADGVWPFTRLTDVPNNPTGEQMYWANLVYSWANRYFSEDPLPNVWLGVSVEDQKTVNERIPLLLETPAAVRFLSIEPLLQRVVLDEITWMNGCGGACLNGCVRHGRPKIDWVIVGGESGSDARPMHPDWVRSIRDQCRSADVPFFFKQGSKADWPDFKNFEALPKEFQIREFPNERTK